MLQLFYQNKLLSLFILFSVVGCSENNLTEKMAKEYEFEIKVAKWYNNAEATVSITVDMPYGRDPRIGKIKDMCIEKNIRMDYELVTAAVDTEERMAIVQQMKNEFPKQGIHLFGHGHHHIKHVELSFEDAYAEFKKCYDLMIEWGLSPKAYAYPGGKGGNPSTQLANKLAGFISARNTTVDQNIIYICKNDESTPQNWYNLPSIIAGAGHPAKIENHSEMKPILNNTLNYKAWLIICYHAIGMKDGYAYYPKDEFIEDLRQIKSSNFWSGNYDDVTCYIKERNSFSYDIKVITLDNNEIGYEMKFISYLNSDIYDFPLTLNISIKDGLDLREMLV